MNEILKLIMAKKGTYALSVYRLVIAVMLGWMLLGDRFVGKVDYEKDKDKQSKVNSELSESLKMISATLIRMESTGKILEDHEIRLRFLEAKR